ncbi:PREDICTED: VITISV_034213, partial [Prunus dulcis]
NFCAQDQETEEFPPSSNPTQPQDPADTNDSSSTRSGDSPTTRGRNDEGYSGAGGSGGYGNYVEPPLEFMSPLTGEANFTHETQHEDHGSRRAGPGIGAIGKDYTRREKGKAILSSQEDASLSLTSDSVGSQIANRKTNCRHGGAHDDGTRTQISTGSNGESNYGGGGFGNVVGILPSRISKQHRGNTEIVVFLDHPSNPTGEFVAHHDGGDPLIKNKSVESGQICAYHG